ncbi:hypothetical protein LX32DRAFT_561241, partial [Colletotrichum zoysiae]
MAPKQPERLKHVAEKATSNNPSQLGDPVSLKAEVSQLSPTEDDLGADSKRGSSSTTKSGGGKGGGGGGGAAGAKNSDGSPVRGPEKKRLKEVAKENLEAGNPTQLGDPPKHPGDDDCVNDEVIAAEAPVISLPAFVKRQDPKPVDVYFHVTSTAAHEDRITGDIVDAQFEVLRSTFSRHGFALSLADVSRVVDDALGGGFYDEGFGVADYDGYAAWRAA